MGVLPAYGPAVGLGHQDRQSATPEDVPVGLGHVLVGRVQAFVVGVEAVGVFHVELPHPYQPGPRTRFVPELRLYLVQEKRQVPVTLHVGLDDVGNDLLVGGRQHHGAAPAVFKGEQVVAESGATARLLPKLQRLQGGHHQLLTTGGVDLLANDGFYLAQGAQGQRQVRVDPGRHLIDEPGLEHQAVARGFGFGRVGAQGPGDQLRDFHDNGSIISRLGTR